MSYNIREVDQHVLDVVTTPQINDFTILPTLPSNKDCCNYISNKCLYNTVIKTKCHKGVVTTSQINVFTISNSGTLCKSCCNYISNKCLYNSLKEIGIRTGVVTTSQINVFTIKVLYHHHHFSL